MFCFFKKKMSNNSGVFSPSPSLTALIGFDSHPDRVHPTTYRPSHCLSPFSLFLLLLSQRRRPAHCDSRQAPAPAHARGTHHRHLSPAGFECRSDGGAECSECGRCGERGCDFPSARCVVALSPHRAQLCLCLVVLFLVICCRRPCCHRAGIAASLTRFAQTDHARSLQVVCTHRRPLCRAGCRVGRGRNDARRIDFHRGAGLLCGGRAIGYGAAAKSA